MGCQETRAPIRILIEDSDPESRSQAHLALGRRAVSRNDVDRAAMHFREAADLDPTDERPRDELRCLGIAPSSMEPAPAPAPSRRATFGRWLFGRSAES